MLLSRCDICGREKSRFIIKQEASGTLSSLSLKTPLCKIQLFGDALFWMLSNHYKMNEIVTKFLLAGEKHMPKMHLKQPRLTY